MLSFPRQIRRGLIEALECGHCRPASHLFPRQIRRGLIEAAPSAPTAFPCAHFRAKFGAASLKQFTVYSAQRFFWAFPRQIRRGLIEAGARGRTVRQAESFPRQIRRGLIEARSIGAKTRRPQLFPRQIRRGLIEAGQRDLQQRRL